MGHGHGRSRSASFKGSVGLSLQKGTQAHFTNLRITEGQGKDSRRSAATTDDLASAWTTLPPGPAPRAPLPPGHGEVVFFEPGQGRQQPGGQPGEDGDDRREPRDPPRDDPPPNDGREDRQDDPPRDDPRRDDPRRDDPPEDDPPGGPPPDPPPPIVAPPPPSQLRVSLLTCSCAASVSAGVGDIQNLARSPVPLGARRAMLARVDFLRRELTRARAAQQPTAAEAVVTAANGQVKRLFVAPEWLFRVPQHADLAQDPRLYVPPLSRGDRDAVVGELERLSRDFPDWLIVPGSIFYTDDLAVHPHAMKNETMLLLGGTMRSLLKRNEFDNLAAYRTEDERDMVQEWAPAHGAPTGPSRFTLGGVRVALEICRDHIVSRALLESTEEVDIHIVISNGTPNIVNSAVVARDNGLLVQVDGSRPKALVATVRRHAAPADLQERQRRWVELNGMIEQSNDRLRANLAAQARVRANEPVNAEDLARLRAEYDVLGAEFDAVWAESAALGEVLSRLVRLTPLFEGGAVPGANHIPPMLYPFQPAPP